MSSEQLGNTEKFLSVQTDAQLYLALKAGQTAALGILYDRHAGLVYGIALKVLENPQEAEDLTQDIFLNFVKIGSYEPNRGSLRTYLAILTRSRAVDRVRSRPRWASAHEPAHQCHQVHLRRTDSAAYLAGGGRGSTECQR